MTANQVDLPPIVGRLESEILMLKADLENERNRADALEEELTDARETLASIHRQMGDGG